MKIADFTLFFWPTLYEKFHSSMHRLTIQPVSATYQPVEYVKPFGVGKRRCLGENLARMELELVLAALVQNFEFSAIDEQSPPSLERQPGMTSKPLPFKCRVEKRRGEDGLMVSDG